MPGNSERRPMDEVFEKVAEKLAQLRAAAPTASQPLLKRTFDGAQRRDFNLALHAAFEEAVAAMRELVARQETRLEQLDRDVTELSSMAATLRELRDRSAAIETQIAQWRKEHSTAVEEQRQRSGEALAEVQAQLNQLRSGQQEKIEQLTAGQKNIANEFTERIQQLLDEQRVSIRQLSLKTSEDAILADRARRATELKLEELARRLPEKPA